MIVTLQVDHDELVHLLKGLDLLQKLSDLI